MSAGPAWAWTSQDFSGLGTSLAPGQSFATYYLGAGSRDRATEMELTSDGRVVLAGYVHNGKDNDLLVMRLLADGSLDTSFGQGRGYAIYGGAGDQMALGLALQADQKIIITGRTAQQGNNEVLTLRYNSDGSLDTSFGGQGAVIFDSPYPGTDTGRAVKLQADGKILVAGEMTSGANKDAMVLRYNPDGSLDTGFGQGGLATFGGPGKADDWAFDLALQADGRILVTGGASYSKTEDIMLWRLNQDGGSDSSFGSNGMSTWAGSGGQSDYGNALALDSQGRILVAGASFDGQNYNTVLLRYKSDGSLDTSFGQDGAAQYASRSGGYDYAWGLLPSGDGRIFMAGVSVGRQGEAPTVFCYQANGSLDPNFGNAGVLQLEVGAQTGRAYDLALGSDGGIWGTGYLNNGQREQVLWFNLATAP